MEDKAGSTCLSKLESDYFYVPEWSKFVVDIREQYPFPLEVAQSMFTLAEEGFDDL